MKVIEHIGIFKNIYSKEFCEDYIKMYYKDIQRYKRTTNVVEDESINLKYYDTPFLKIFWKNCYTIFKYSRRRSNLFSRTKHKNKTRTRKINFVASIFYTSP